MASRNRASPEGFVGEFGEVPFEMFEFGLGEVFQIGQFVARSFIDPDQLVEFEMQRCTIVVLRVLDKKHHQERDDRGARIDDQLPGIGKLKNRPVTAQTTMSAHATAKVDARLHCRADRHLSPTRRRPQVRSDCAVQNVEAAGQGNGRNGVEAK